ncbi:efflux RND transporter periplasmic adaptor subunit [Ruficoccus sp. ZRK36]|uniref:efflux RND transporter periplasmic adaptor subunit n=1 Tax=Ruficoccus sp. ZRK36 TaxID=2866311 RepID=UPI001C739ADC|nr:efflux RND transporter periplasmic adaptor subunit [Ruficoccus sp. ZRK36]QYY35005.1 efflux RND transporter periplasmic adaptor subunit [Ruficoccus sp. ZRK36]
MRPTLFLATLLGLSQATLAYSDTDTHDHGDHSGHSHADEGSPADGHGDEDEHHDHEEGVVVLSPEVLEEFGIELAQAGPGTLHEEVILPGEIQFNREHVAYVTPRYASTVLEIKARLADPVKQGQVLAMLESTDTLRPFEITAPFDGVITAYEITQGETVEAGAPLFTVADLSTLWADLRIYQRDLGKVTRGQPVLITGGHEGGEFRGTVGYIAPVIDEHTRTGLVRVVVENAEGLWKPGQFIKGSVTVGNHHADIVIPRTAVLDYEGQTVVFVQTDDGFEPRPIVLGHGDADSLAVESGLEPGETYVAQNPISLKAELGKGSFGGHQH